MAAAWDVSPAFTVVADARNRFGDGLDTGPAFHVGVGAEYRPARVFEVRGGAAVIQDGTQVGGGASLVVGPVSLSAAAALRSTDAFDSVLGQFTLSFGGR